MHHKSVASLLLLQLTLITCIRCRIFFTGSVRWHCDYRC